MSATGSSSVSICATTGTDCALIVNFGTIPDMLNAFETAYRMRYSFLMQGRALIAEGGVGRGD